MKRKTKKVGWLAIIIATVCVLFVPSGMTEVCPELPTVITFNDIEIGVDTLVGDLSPVVIDNFTFIWGESPVCGSGYGGYVESIDAVVSAHSRLFVHTYNENPPPPYVAQFIHCEVFVEELRSNRELAYILFPTMDIYSNGEWFNGPVLGGFIVWENDIFGRTYVGKYGVGVIVTEDKANLYRNNIFCYIEVDRGPDWIKFEFADKETSLAGIWFKDIYPYSHVERKVVNNALVKNMFVGNLIGSEILEMVQFGGMSQ